MFSKILQGNIKYFTLSVFFVIITLLLEAFTPYIINRTEKNWDNILKEEIEEIKFFIIQQVREKEEKIEAAEEQLTNNIKSTNTKIDSAGIVFQKLTDEKYKDLNIEIYNSNFELLAWNKDNIFSEENILGNNFSPGEDFFYTYKLKTFLSRIDTFITEDQIYLIAVSLPFEKHFTIQDKYFEAQNFLANMEERYKTPFEINYSPEAAYSLDGRKHSFEILNNFNNKIGLITFEKPLKVNAVSDAEDFKFKLQAAFLILAYIFLGVGFFKYFYSLKSQFLKFIILMIYFAGFRIVFFLLKFPSFFFGGDLNNPAYFSSQFVFGIVRSPMEFFISIVLLLIIIIAAYRFAVKYYFDEKGKSGWINFVPALIFYTFLFLISLRGFESSIRSVIFDSTLLFFKEKDLVPALPAALMQFNILILGVAVLTFSSILIILVFKRLPLKFRSLTVFSFLFLFFQIAGMLYDIYQVNPQGTHLIRIIYISLSFVISYLIIYSKQVRYWTFVYITFAASFISITLLNHYNSELERASVSLITNELAQPRENWIDFLVNETLNFAKTPETIYPVSNKVNVNYDALAFSIWSRSSLKRESLTSAVAFIDAEKNIAGKFCYGMQWNESFNDTIIPEDQILRNDTTDTDDIYIVGAVPVKLDGEEFSFVVSALEKEQGIPVENEPDFMTGKRLFESAAVNVENLLIFEIVDNKLSSIVGDVNFTPAQIEYIKNNIRGKNEIRLDIVSGNDVYSAYVVKSGERIIAAAQKEKEISWSLYDFFKVFFIHSIFIILLIIFLLSFSYSKSREVKLTFRSQLLMALLLTSIIPLILLAFYFRNLTEEKNDSAIYYKLQKRAISVEAFVKKYNNNEETIPDSLFMRANEDLGIDFTIYENKNISYSANKNYYEVGLLPEIIYPEVYRSLIINGAGEILVEETIDGYKFNAFYYKSGLGSGNIIYKVSDSFNNILLPLSATELDTFLFGSYFLAVILIMIISALLANQISSPIRKLTVATKSVAGGDLNIEVTEQRKGEVKELIDGFNKMVKELKKIQTDMAEVEREAAWKEMAKQVAHEIKNPLTPMKLAVQQLVAAYKDKSPKFDEIFNKVTGTVISQIDTLKNIASEFSSFARMPNVKLETVNLPEVINDAANLFIEEKVKFEIVSEAREAFVNADRDQLKRLLINLIRNSVQANSTLIVIDLKEENNFYRLAITDNGSGMPEEIISKIFQQDFTTKIKGMGLGLTMAKRYIESINGSIEVANTSENGTSILIKLIKN